MRTVVYLALAVVLQLTVAAQEPRVSGTSAPAASGPPPHSLLDTFLAHMREADHLQFRVQSVSRHTAGDKKASEELTYEFRWRPGNLAMTMQMEGETLQVVIKGDQLLMSLAAKREYVLCAPPKNLETFVGWLTNEPVLKQFFRTPPFDGVKQLYTVHAQEETGHGGTCYELALAGTDVHVFLERDASGHPRLQRIVADTSRGGNHPKGSHVTELLFTPLPPADPPFTFDLTPPRGFRQVEWFSVDADSDSPQVNSLKTLPGAPLPPFDLERLEGDSISLAELRGKHVILLDFWATWCRPCRATLKTLDNMKTRFGDKLYTLAINETDSRKRVQSYRKHFDLESDIAFDHGGVFSAELGVEFFPCAILVGLDGTIQAIHSGTDRFLEQTLAGEIEQVIAGRDLVESAIRYTARERLYYRLALNATDYCNAFVNY